MEKVCEVLVKKKKTFVTVLESLFLFVGALCIAIVFSAQFPAFAIVISALVFYIAYCVYQKLDLEYEYTYVNGDLDVDKIFSKKKRKRFFEITLDKILFIGECDNPYIKKNAYGAKTTDVSSDIKADDNYAIIINGEKGKQLLIIDNCKIIDMYKELIPEKVFK